MMLNSFLVGDCVDVMRKEIETNSIDCVITSPPYDDVRDYNGYTFEINKIIKELYRVLKVGGVVV